MANGIIIKISVGINPTEIFFKEVKTLKKEERNIVSIIQKTVYLEEELDQKFRIQVIVEKTNQTKLINKILREYFIKCEKQDLKQ